MKYESVVIGVTVLSLLGAEVVTARMPTVPKQHLFTISMPDVTQYHTTHAHVDAGLYRAMNQSSSYLTTGYRAL